MSVMPRFPLLGEPLALDLVNTRMHRGGAKVDLLEEPAALDAWLHAERDRIGWEGPAREADLKAVRALRDAIDTLFRARLEGSESQPLAAVRSLNQALSAPVPGPRLAWTSAGPRKSPPAVNARRRALLRQLALDALDLLTGPTGERVRQCAHPDCILLFVATHPRRRWCSAALCGNRARVARHYQRQRQEQ